MPFFQLKPDDLSFPPGHFADEEGMIAVGGDLSPARVVEAYRNGIYFWFGPMDFIKWWSPNPRIVLYPDVVPAPEPHRLQGLRVVYQQDFPDFLRRLQQQENQSPMAENWITEEMINTYSALHQQGVAQCLVLYREEELVGGLLGLQLGKAFFIEYTYGQDTNLTDLAVQVLAARLRETGGQLIDVQKESVRISAALELEEISRMDYLDRIRLAMASRVQTEKL
jgi:leucyl/phenylalanyl-tRNA--protein transferase